MREFINAICRTNLDGYDCSMITKFVALPRIGDYVSVSQSKYAVKLKIVQITHCQTPDGDPYILIELNH